jgi:hypothetical protein
MSTAHGVVVLGQVTDTTALMPIFNYVYSRPQAPKRAFVDTLLQYSRSDRIEEAVTEWTWVRREFGEYHTLHTGECICGKTGLSWVMVLFNPTTETEIRVGSSCIGYFGNSRMTAMCKEIELANGRMIAHAKREIEHAIDAIKMGASIGDIDRAMLNPPMLHDSNRAYWLERGRHNAFHDIYEREERALKRVYELEAAAKQKAEEAARVAAYQSLTPSQKLRQRQQKRERFTLGSQHDASAQNAKRARHTVEAKLAGDAAMAQLAVLEAEQLEEQEFNLARKKREEATRVAAAAAAAPAASVFTAPTRGVDPFALLMDGDDTRSFEQRRQDRIDFDLEVNRHNQIRQWRKEAASWYPSTGTLDPLWPDERKSVPTTMEEYHSRMRVWYANQSISHRIFERQRIATLLGCAAEELMTDEAVASHTATLAKSNSLSSTNHANGLKHLESNLSHCAAQVKRYRASEVAAQQKTTVAAAFSTIPPLHPLIAAADAARKRKKHSTDNEAPEVYAKLAARYESRLPTLRAEIVAFCK